MPQDPILEHKDGTHHAKRDAALLALPLFGALAVIGTLPPINLWPLMFLALAPVYAHIYITLTSRASWIRLAWGGFFFGVIFSGFLMSETILQFHWIQKAYLFGTLVKLSMIPLLVATGIFASLSILFSGYAARKISSIKPLVRLRSKLSLPAELAAVDFIAILSSAAIWTLSEWVIRKCMFSIEYSIMGYPASSTFLISMTSIGGIFLTVFFASLISMSIGSIAFQVVRLFVHKNARTFLIQILPGLLISLTAVCVAWGVHVSLQNKHADETSGAQELTVSIIQDQAREGDVFGKEQNGTYAFPRLESFLAETRKKKQDMIIYPFAPWNGALYDAEKDGYRKKLFSKDVLAASIQAFGKWEKDHVNPGVVFVTWATTYRDSKFLNEITYWKDGKLIGTHQKRDLFPFLDYTPGAAARMGFFTTAVDAAPGTSTLSEEINGISIGALVCSEVTHTVSESTSADRDLILSIGSEAFFSNGIAGYLNLANAKYRAVESQKPVIRANRLGPSAFIDQDGNVTDLAPYGFTGVFTSTVNVPKSSSYR